MEILELINGPMIFVWALISVITIMMESSRFYGDHFSFALGGLAGILCWVLGLNPIIQLVAFAAVTGISFLAFRPLFQKMVAKFEAKEHLEEDIWVGRTGVVTVKVDINIEENNGRVRIDDHELRAKALDPKQKYNIGDRVKVVGVDKNCLVVKK